MNLSPRCKHCWTEMRFHRILSVQITCMNIQKLDTASWGEEMTLEELTLWNEMQIQK